MSHWLAPRVLGRTGIKLPLLGFGAAPLGGVYRQWGDPQKAVDRAVELGVGYFDTSPYYGNSEEILGDLLAGKPRDKFLISTKCGRLVEDKFDYSPEWIERSVKRSLRRLGISHVDMLVLHDVEFAPDWKEVAQKALPAAQGLKEKGLVRSIGFSCYPLSVAQKFLNGPNNELIDFVLLYGHNNLIDNTVLAMAEDLKKKGIGLIDASPLCLGLLVDKEPPEWHAAPAEVKTTVSNLAKTLQSNLGISLQQTALRHAFRMTPGSSLLVGMSSAKEVEANVSLVKEVVANQTLKEAAEAEDLAISQLRKYCGIKLS